MSFAQGFKITRKKMLIIIGRSRPAPVNPARETESTLSTILDELGSPRKNAPGAENFKKPQYRIRVQICLFGHPSGPRPMERARLPKFGSR